MLPKMGSLMSLSRELLREVRALDEYDLRRLMLFAGEMVAVRTGSPSISEPSRRAAGGHRVSYRQQRVRCGKAGCTRCPHGPYWYAFWREGGRVRSQYVGKQLPGEAKGLLRSEE
jgi:hypothetical protein